MGGNGKEAKLNLRGFLFRQKHVYYIKLLILSSRQNQKTLDKSLKELARTAL